MTDLPPDKVRTILSVLSCDRLRGHLSAWAFRDHAIIAEATA